MIVVERPNKKEWMKYTSRPGIEKHELDELVSKVIEDVQQNGDKAVQRYTEKFDGVQLSQFKVAGEEFYKAVGLVSEDLKNAIALAKDNIEKFHKSQILKEPKVETIEGVECWRKSVAIEKVGLYIPGGSAPLFSTILMLTIPAKLAGCKEIVICTPANSSGEVNPAILYTCQLLGVTNVFKVGGAQAIAAMACGTESIPSVYKIFGPGNQFVTKAKELIQQKGVAIDMPAGPSEVLVMADRSCKPSFVAADLLSQAEHGADSQVILLSDDIEVINDVSLELSKQLKNLPRKDLAEQALQNSRAISLNNFEECIDFSNEYAPEHLIIASESALECVDSIVNAGSVFLGNYSCESAGDYASGTNHTLPTNSFARNYSGVSIDSFVKKITFQNLNKKGIENIGPAIEIMAEAEELYAHKNAVTLRLNEIRNV
ncbi:MAG: histidinol dehydrogenase [Flavobacteriales bacterium]|nr:histidinol dehydrogenase [Flavobacteriales bacterium]